MKELHVRKTALITGFEPFNGAALNPSQEVVTQLSSRDFNDLHLVTAILPCVFSKASAELIELIKRNNPDVVISLGQAEGRTHISPEKIAINFDDARIADNAGEKRQNVPIIAGAPDGYFSTLPIDEIVKEISTAGLPAQKSLSAGAFLCNNVFYAMQHYLQGTEVKSGFIHLPLMNEQKEDFPNQPTLELTDMTSAISIAIRVACKS